MRRRLLCGVDIGGTKLSVGLMRSEGLLIDVRTMYDHVHKEPDAIISQIVHAIRDLLERNSVTEAELLGIGVATAGHLRHRDGILITMSNLKGFEDYPIRDRIQAGFRPPVLVDNDANAQAYGEYKYGAGVGSKNMIFMTLSTQVGAGLVLDGRLFRGTTGTAGEIGHTIVEPGSDLICPCGNHGCLIAVASGVALPEVARRKIAVGTESKLIGGEGYDFSQVTGELVKRGLDQGDPLCESIVADYARYVGIACYNLFQIFNPQVIVLGGGLLSWGEVFVEAITSRFRTLAGRMMYDEVAIRTAGVGTHSGVIGAASLLIEGT